MVNRSGDSTDLSPDDPGQDPRSALAARGDHDALHALRGELSPGLRRFLARKAGPRPELIEELEQRAWSLVLLAIHERRYDPSRARFSTFLYAVASKVWLRHAERHAVRSRILDRASDQIARRRLDPRTDDPSDTLALAELLDAVRGAMRDNAELTEDQRQILAAVARGTTDRELARDLGVAASTAFARRTSAIAALRSLLARRGFRPERDEGPAESPPDVARKPRP